jgi:hypothetical protein
MTQPDPHGEQPEESLDDPVDWNLVHDGKATEDDWLRWAEN